MHEFIQKWVKRLQRFVDRHWYPPLLGFLAASDNLLLIVPTDGLLISSSILTPKRWFWLAVSIAIGSTLGAVVLAALVEFHGLPWILEMYPSLTQTKSWVLSSQFFDQYGLFLVFVVAATPLMQQPTVILAALANTPLAELAAVVFLGRFIKFFIMAYIGSHAPNLIKKMWGVRGELKDVGVKIPKDTETGRP